MVKGIGDEISFLEILLGGITSFTPFERIFERGDSRSILFADTKLMAELNGVLKKIDSPRKRSESSNRREYSRNRRNKARFVAAALFPEKC